MIAFAYRSGEINFGSKAPPGTLFIAKGRERDIGPMVRGLARLAYDGETYLVPGLPEAKDEEEAFRAFMVFFERVRASVAKMVQP